MLDNTSYLVKAFLSFNRYKVDYSKPNQYWKNWAWQRVHTLNDVAKLILSSAWSNSIWSGEFRKETDWRVSYFCAVDVDSGYPLEQAINELADTQHVIGTTKSHGVKGDRFRIVIPWTTPIKSLPAYRFDIKRMIQKYDGDPAACDGARFFWPCKEIVSINALGEYMEDVQDPPASHLIPPAVKYQKYAEMKVLPSWIRHQLEHGVRDGERNNAVYSVAKALRMCGMDKEQIFTTIRHSKIPKPTAPDEELLKAITSAVKKAESLISQGDQRKNL